MNLSPNSRGLIVLLGALLFITVVQGQEPVQVERSSNKVILEGKVYYIHVVEPGQTLYAISRAYNISQKEIAIENPGVMSGLQLGQALKIPVTPSLEKEIDTSGLDELESEGKVHVVRAGETLFSIAKMYGTDEESILLANPGLEADNLRQGQAILIPDLAKEHQESVFNEEGFVYHKVKRRETLYSIAKFYEVTVEDIRNANPELGWGGPKTGQVIRIPLPQVVDHPNIFLDTIPPDTVQTVILDTIREPYTYGELEYGRDELNRTFRVAFFIPFDFQEPEPLDSLIKDIKSEARKNRIIERYMMEQRIPQSVNFLEFFEGSLLALDSLSRAGMKVDVRFFDTKRSMDRMLSILAEESLQDFDLFIGPFYLFNLELVSAYCQEHRIPLVTPFYNELDLVNENPYLFQVSPSMEEEYRQAARLVASKYRYNIVYVREQDSLNIERHEYFKGLIFSGIENYRPSEPVVFKEVVLEMGETEEIIHSLSPDRKNLVVIPTGNQALASTVISSLFFQSGNYDIEVLGTPYWTEFTSIDFRYYHTLNLIFYSSFWVDYTDPHTEQYLSKFRAVYRDEPRSTSRKGMNFGIIGYDITFYFLNALRLHGNHFILELDQYEPELIQGPLRFERVSPAGGYENRNVDFYQFNPDMEIQQIEVPDYPRRRYYFRPIEDTRKRRYLNLDNELN
jgi:LysM repeat protein